MYRPAIFRNSLPVYSFLSSLVAVTDVSACSEITAVSGFVRQSNFIASSFPPTYSIIKSFVAG